MSAFHTAPSPEAETIDGSQKDVFIFSNQATTHVVTDFTPGQKMVQLVGFGGDFNTLSHYLTQDGQDALLVLQDSHVVKFVGVNMHDIDAADFQFA